MVVSRRSTFDALYAQHAAAVKAYVVRRAQSSIADDVVADTFMVCWRRLEDVPEDPLPWLLGVAARVLKTHRRSDSRGRRLRERLAGGQRTADPAPSLSLDGTLGAAVRRMREDDRDLLLLIAWEGLTPSQAAAVLGIRPATARVRLHRARERLRLELADSGEEPGTHRARAGRSELSVEASQ